MGHPPYGNRWHQNVTAGTGNQVDMPTDNTTNKISTTGISRRCSRPSSANCCGSRTPVGLASARSTSSARARAAAKRSRSARRASARGGLGELLTEALDTSGGVHETLFPGVERVAG